MARRRLTAAERAKIFKALSDPHRVRIVDELTKGSQCGTDLAEALGISTALLCHHWDVLVDAGILHKQRVGQLRMCSVELDRIREAMGGWEPGAEAPVPVRSKRPAKP